MLKLTDKIDESNDYSGALRKASSHGYTRIIDHCRMQLKGPGEEASRRVKVLLCGGDSGEIVILGSVNETRGEIFTLYKYIEI